MSSIYKGLRVPDPTDAADVPGMMRLFTDSGPIPRFANPSARNSGIGAPVNGQVIYLGDTKRLQIYEDTGWKDLTKWDNLHDVPTTFPPGTHNHDTVYLKQTGDAVLGPGGINMNGFILSNPKDPTAGNHVGDRAYSDKRYALLPTNVSSPDTATAVIISGGSNPQTMVNNLRVDTYYIGNATKQCYITDYQKAGDEIRIAINNNAEYRMQAGWFASIDDGFKNLGHTDLAWKNVYYSNALVKSSSATLKDDIEPHDFDALEAIRRIIPKRFKWRSDHSEDIGFIAEEMPDTIQHMDDEATLPHIATDRLIVWLWQAVRQLSARLDELEPDER